MTRLRLADPADPGLAEVIADGVARYGRPLNAWLAIGHRPEVLRQYFPFLFATFERGPLDQRVKLLVALRTVVQAGCHYTTSHRWNAAVSAGIEEELVSDAAAGFAPGDDEPLRLSLELCEAMAEPDDGACESIIAACTDLLGDPATVELAFTIGLWSGLARTNRALDLELDMPPAPVSVQRAVDLARASRR